MEIVYIDRDIVVCIKPPRVLSTDEPDGLPQLLREQINDPNADVRTVHRLDRVVSGLMVLARNAESASELSRQIRDGEFEKSYLAIIHGKMDVAAGELRDLLGRDKARRMTFVSEQTGKGIQEAILRYQTMNEAENLTRVKIELITGRTHQIRVQFSSRNHPLVGERKYAVLNDPCEIALFSCSLRFTHPRTGEPLLFIQDPPQVYPWTVV